jgi:transposase-like protein
MAKLSENAQEYIRQAFKSKKDIKEISEVSGVNKSTLSSWLKKGLII